MHSAHFDDLISLEITFNEGWDQEQAWDDGTCSYGYDAGAASQSQEGANGFEDHSPEVQQYVHIYLASAQEFSEQWRPPLVAAMHHRNETSRSTDARAFPPHCIFAWGCFEHRSPDASVFTSTCTHRLFRRQCLAAGVRCV